MRGAFFRLLLTTLVAGPTVRAFADPLPEYAQVSVSGRGACTGAVVLMGLRRYFVTAGHCLTGLDQDATISVSEGATLARQAVVNRTGGIELKVSDATRLVEFDVAMWPLNIADLNHTLTLIPRLGETSPGEVVLAVGYPGQDGLSRLRCAAQSGTLTQVDGGAFRPAQMMTCDTSLARLNGISGGPVLDLNGRYLGLMDYQSVSGVAGEARAGFVPYRVFKMYERADGRRECAGVRSGFTFRDFVAASDGSISVHAGFAGGGDDKVIHSRLTTIEIRGPKVAVELDARDDHALRASFDRLRALSPPDDSIRRASFGGLSYAAIREAIIQLSQ